jgi:hypothetical protein
MARWREIIPDQSRGPFPAAFGGGRGRAGRCRDVRLTAAPRAWGPAVLPRYFIKLQSARASGMLPPPWASRLTPGAGRSVAARLGRLNVTLADLTERLRLAVAATLGQTVAGLVQDVVLAAVDLPPAAPPPHPYRYQPSGYSRSSWDDPRDQDGERWFYDPDDLPEDDDDDEPEHLSTADASGPRTSRVLHAVAAGLAAALSSARRRSGRSAVAAALGAGLVAALATYLGGPLAVACVALTGLAVP